jgi:hypothetical protein
MKKSLIKVLFQIKNQIPGYSEFDSQLTSLIGVILDKDADLVYSISDVEEI